MPTTIQISNEVKQTLDNMKLFDRDTYNEILERMIEEELRLNEKTKKEIEEAKKRVRSGKFLTHHQVKRSLGL